MQQFARELADVDDADLVGDAERAAREQRRARGHCVRRTTRSSGSPRPISSRTTPRYPTDEVVLQLRQARAVRQRRAAGRTASTRSSPPPRSRRRRRTRSSSSCRRRSRSSSGSARSRTPCKAATTRSIELTFLRTALKTSFTLTLSLVLLISLLASVYGAFYFSRRLVDADPAADAGHARRGARRLRDARADAGARRDRLPRALVQRHDAAARAGERGRAARASSRSSASGASSR